VANATIDGWEIISQPPTKDARGHDVPLARRAAWELRYKGVRGLLSAGGVMIVWPEQPDIHGLVFTPATAVPIIDFYMGDRKDWPFKWIRIIPVAERDKIRRSLALAVPRAPQEQVPLAVTPPPQPVPSDIPEALPVTTPPVPAPVTPPARVPQKKLTKKDQAKMARLSRDPVTGKLVF
jgi:hypothetical protein